METANAPVILEAVDLRKWYGATKAVDGVTLRAKAGEIVAVIGANGAGKSTLLYLLGGLVLPGSGRVRVLGEDRWRANFAIRKRCSFLSAEPDFGDCPTPWDYLQYVGAAYGFTPHQLAQRVEPLADQMSMLPHFGRPIAELSLGMRKKVGLIAAFTPESEIYFLDEPFAGGIDPLAMEVLRTWIARAGRAGATVLFSTQVLDQTDELASRLMVLLDGQLRYDDSPAALIRRAGIDPAENRAIHKAFATLVGARTAGSGNNHQPGSR